VLRLQHKVDIPGSQEQQVTPVVEPLLQHRVDTQDSKEVTPAVELRQDKVDIPVRTILEPDQVTQDLRLDTIQDRLMGELHLKVPEQDLHQDKAMVEVVTLLEVDRLIRKWLNGSTL